MTKALSAFATEDYAAAERAADSVLARDPNHEAARGLRDRARASATAVDTGLKRARTLAGKGQFEEASRAAGNVLSVAPGNVEAKRIMEDGAARSRGRGAEEARSRVARAKASARSAGAERLASGSYGAAVAAAREAERLFDAGRGGEATVKFYEASGLFRSAEISAENEAAARLARARPEPTAAEKPVGTDAGRDTSTVAASPAAPVSPPDTREQPRAPATPPLTPEVIVPSAPPPAVPAPPPSATPAAQPSASPEALAALREAAIGELLTRYKSSIETRNLDALKRLWPGLAPSAQEAMRVEFQRATRISVDIVDPRVSGSGDAATINFIRRYEVLTVDGSRLQSESHATMDVRRTGGTWTIERIRFDSRR